MIIRSLRVSDWRCFLQGVEVGPFEEGLNIIHAPNGTGKSTLFEALRRALLDGHKVTGKDVEAIRPWGRSLSPVNTGLKLPLYQRSDVSPFLIYVIRIIAMVKK